jgi:hypothetical protein
VTDCTGALPFSSGPCQSNIVSTNSSGSARQATSSLAIVSRSFSARASAVMISPTVGPRSHSRSPTNSQSASRTPCYQPTCAANRRWSRFQFSILANRSSSSCLELISTLHVRFRGQTSKMGERTLRRLLIIGSSAVVLQASKRGAPRGSWARTNAGSQTAHAGDRRARQQDGADHLGATCKAGKLQSSGRSPGVSLADLRSSQA